MAASISSKTKIQQMYVAYYGRPGDPAGIEFWGEVLDVAEATGGSIDNIISAFGNSDEYTNGIGSGTTTEQVTSLYQQMFNRDPEAEGLAFWVNEIDTGARTLGEVALAIAESAQNDDATILANKVAAADYYTEQLTATGAAYDSTHIASAQAMLNDVTSDPVTVVSSKTVTDGLMVDQGGTGGGDSATQFSLTTGVDAIVGTSGDDTFNGPAGTNAISGALQDTLQSVDTIGGGEGTDKLVGQLGSAAAASFAGTVSDIETVDLTVFNGSTFNMANVSGATTINSAGSVGALTITNAGNLFDLGVSSSKAAVTATFTDAAVQGTTDSTMINLSTANGSQAVTLNNTTAGTIETLGVDSSGAANNVSIAGSALVSTGTLNITGDQNLTMTTTGMTGMKTVDGSAATGNLSLNLSSTIAQNMTITTGTGDDSLTLAGFDANDSVDTGDGTDTVTLAALTASLGTAVTLTNVEKLGLSATTSSSINLANASALTDLIITGTSAVTITASKLAASADNVTWNNGGGTTATSMSALNYNLNTSSGSSDALTVNVINQTAASVDTDITAGTVTTIQGLTANGVEEVTVNTSNLGDTTSTGTLGGVAFTAFSGDKLQKVTISSDSYVNIGTIATTTMNTVDASAASAGIAINVAAATNSSSTSSTAVSITGGAGADTITAATGGTNSISTGAGKDVVTMGVSTKSNTIDLGDDNDTIQLAGATASLFDTITTGSGTDTIKIDSADTVTANTAITAKAIVTDFTVAAAGDKIDFDTNQAFDGPASAVLVNFEQVAAAGATTTGTGLFALDENIDLSTATTNATLENAVETVLGGNTLTDFDAADSAIYLAIDDGADTYILFLESGGTNTAFTQAEDTAHIVLKLSGVTDVTKLTTDNFADFL